jgi:hypothetical protein
MIFYEPYKKNNRRCSSASAATHEVTVQRNQYLMEENMLLHQQLILGIAASLTFLALLRWVPLFREFLALTTFASLALLLITGQSSRELNPPSLFGQLFGYVQAYPHFFLGVVLATTVVLAVLYASRPR